MSNSQISVSEGSGKNIDTRTTSTDGDHRQVVVIGDPSSDNAVAVVQATDPDSNAEGIVVREPNTTAIVSGLRDVRVQSIVDGSLTTLNTLTRVDRVMNIVDGTMTVNFASGSDIDTVTRVDRVHNLVDGTISSGTLDYVSRIRNLVDGTISTITRVDRVMNIVDGTISLPSTQDLDTITRVDRVMNIVDGTISLPATQDLDTITRVDRVINLVDGTISAGTLDYVTRVRNLVDGTLTTVSNVSTVAAVTNITNTVAVYFDRGNPGVNVAQYGGNNAITPNSGIPAVNVYNTTSIFTVSGTTSGGTTSGVTLISPSANYNFKIFAFNLQTTAIASTVWTFTDGSGASPSEFWRPLVTPAASTSVPVGANLAVQPPGFLFATGTSTTLALKSDTGSLVHYSVSFIKESA